MPHAETRAYADFLGERPLPGRVLEALMLIRDEVRKAKTARYAIGAASSTRSGLTSRQSGKR